MRIDILHKANLLICGTLLKNYIFYDIIYERKAGVINGTL